MIFVITFDQSVYWYIFHNVIESSHLNEAVSETGVYYQSN